MSSTYCAWPSTKRRAWGLGCAYKNVGFGSGAYDAAGAEVEVYANGRAAVRAGAALDSDQSARDFAADPIVHRGGFRRNGERHQAFIALDHNIKLSVWT